ncbi:MAG: hypothetical protein IPG53_13765 [Ignavibacteriales bacterium]|nr:hypothetical protein [Ignavibacteriales bacterium]
MLPVLSIFISQEAGIVTPKEKLTEHFKDGIITKHFLILSEELMTPSERVYYAHLHETYYEELLSFYEVKPVRHLQSVIFSSSATKKKYLGIENADAAKPWLGQAYTTRSNIERSLKHELAHLFTSEFGWSIFKIAGLFNPALIEERRRQQMDLLVDIRLISLRQRYLNPNIKRMYPGSFQDLTSFRSILLWLIW